MCVRSFYSISDSRCVPSGHFPSENPFYALFPAPSRSATSAINSPLADSPSSKWVDFRPQNHANNLVFIASSTFYLLAFFYIIVYHTLHGVCFTISILFVFSSISFGSCSDYAAFQGLHPPDTFARPSPAFFSFLL